MKSTSTPPQMPSLHPLKRRAPCIRIDDQPLMPSELRIGVVVPSAGDELMSGSVGELTVVDRIVRSCAASSVQFEIAACVGGRADARAVLPGAVERVIGSGELLSLRPDMVLFSTYRAFYQFPVCRTESDKLFAECRAQSIPVALLDPCGDSLLSAEPSGFITLLPCPFSYDATYTDQQLCFGVDVEISQTQRMSRLLWANGGWMQRFVSFRAAERVGLHLLDTVGAAVDVLKPLGTSVRPSTVDDLAAQASYDEMTGFIRGYAAVVTANRRSVLAARACSAGVPIILVDPSLLETDAAYDGETNRLIAAARREHLPDSPLPKEFMRVDTSSESSAIASLSSILGSIDQRSERLVRPSYELPTFEACARGVVAQYRA